MVELGYYYPADSALHRCRASIKLLGLLLLAVGTIWWREPWHTGVLVATVLSLYALARLPLRLWWKQTRPTLLILLALAIFQYLVAGWKMAVVVPGNLFALILLAGLISCTTRASDLIDVVTQGARPLKIFGVSPHRIGLYLSLGIRSIPLMVSIATQLREAQIARGLPLRPTTFAVPFLVGALRQADALGEALAARGIVDDAAGHTPSTEVMAKPTRSP